jgi:hypothetical protein
LARSGPGGPAHVPLRESVLFIGTQFSNLYTTVDIRSRTSRETFPTAQLERLRRPDPQLRQLVWAAGKYSTALGASVASSCVDCDTCKYSTTVGASAYSKCTDCPANSLSPSASNLLVWCQCNAGYTGVNGGTCTVCVV